VTTPVLDSFLLDHAPSPLTRVDPGLVRARESLRAALDDLAAVPDSALELPWLWRGSDVDVRYGFYRQYEAISEVGARVRPLLARAASVEPPARPMLGAATAARWDLHGLLTGLSDDDLDRDPGGGEWTIRQTLGHTVGGQRAYGWFTAWWHSRHDAFAGDLPARVPDEVAEASGLPSDDDEGVGTLAEIRTRLDDITDLSAGVFAGVDEEDLAARARWSGYAVDVRFRLNRWASHMREHTIQVDKTLVMLGRPTSEVERLLRLIAAGYGRVEEDLFMWPATAESVLEACAALAEATAAIEMQARGIRAAAEAGAGNAA
jgi:hypothetical protein